MSRRAFVVGLGSEPARPGDVVRLEGITPRAMVATSLVLQNTDQFELLELELPGKADYQLEFAGDYSLRRITFPEGLTLAPGMRVKLRLRCTRPRSLMRWLLRKRDVASGAVIGTAHEG